MAIWPLGPLHNAKDVSLSNNPGTLPSLSDSIMQWFQLLTFDKVIKQTINYQLVETTQPVQFMGVKQPFKSQALRMKPEGQRLWKWFTIHALPTLLLQPDDVIKDQSGTQYRVMEKRDYKEYGYVKYEIIEDYTGSGPSTALQSGSIFFNGLNQGISLPSSLQIEYTTALSINGWFYSGSTTSTNLLIDARDAANDDQGYGLGFAAPHYFGFQLKPNGSAGLQVICSPGLTPNTWYNFGLTYDGSYTLSGTNLYINGVLQSTILAHGGSPASTLATVPVMLGIPSAISSQGYFEGNMSNVTFWKGTVLSQSQITALNGAGRPVDVKTLPFYNLLTAGYYLNSLDSLTAANGVHDVTNQYPGTAINMTPNNFNTNYPGA